MRPWDRTLAAIALRSGQVISKNPPPGRRTLRNSAKAMGTSCASRCSMLWEEKIASTEAAGTSGIAVMVSVRSGSAAHMQNGSGSKQAMGHGFVGWVDGISVAQGLSRRKPPSAALRCR